MSGRGWVRSMAVACIAAATGMAGALPARGAARATPTITVTTTADLPSPCSGSVSLRCAIAGANHAAYGRFTARFPPGGKFDHPLQHVGLICAIVRWDTPPVAVEWTKVHLWSSHRASTAS